MSSDKSSVKFQDTRLFVHKNPTIIVGQNPANGAPTGYSWDYGARSSDFLRDILEELEADNVILTNICKYQQMTIERVAEGLDELDELVMAENPKVVLCLGNFAFVYVHAMDSVVQHVPVVKLPHPSFIVRFNKDREAYKRQIEGVLCLQRSVS